MSIIKKMRKQKATWWKRIGPDKFGKYSHTDPIEIDCRWDDGGEEWRDPQQQLHMPMATVYVDREMSVGDKLKKGEMDSNTPTDPTLTTGAHEIKRFTNNPNLRATEFLLTAFL